MARASSTHSACMPAWGVVAATSATSVVEQELAQLEESAATAAWEAWQLEAAQSWFQDLTPITIRS